MNSEVDDENKTAVRPKRSITKFSVSALFCIALILAFFYSYIYDIMWIPGPFLIFNTSVSIVLIFESCIILKSKRTIITLAYAISLLFFLGTLYYVLSSLDTSSEAGLSSFFFWLLFVYVGLCSLYLIVTFSNLPTFIKNLIQSIIICLAVCPVIAYCTFDLRLTSIVLEKYFSGFLTNNEFWGSGEIVKVYTHFCLKSLFVILCLFFILSSFSCKAVSTSTKNKLKVVCLIAFTSVILLSVSNKPFERVFSNNFDQHKYLYDKMSDRQNPLDSGKYAIEDNSTGGLYFFIIGECHNLKPTLRLAKKYNTFYSKILKDPDYICFSNAHSWRKPEYSGYISFTEHCIAHMISSASQKEDLTYLYKNLNLMDIMEKTGYKTLWISNIGQYSHATPSLKFWYNMSDYTMVNFKDSFNGKYADKGMQIDSEIPRVIKELYRTNKIDHKRSFMFIKLAGLHGGEIIPPEEIKNKYPGLSKNDQGLIYYGQNLEQIMSVLTSFPETKAIIYSSDHSDNADEKKPVTMYIYLSPGLQRENPGLKQSLKDIASNRFMTTGIYNLFLKIMNIKIKP